MKLRSIIDDAITRTLNNTELCSLPLIQVYLAKEFQELFYACEKIEMATILKGKPRTMLDKIWDGSSLR